MNPLFVIEKQNCTICLEEMNLVKSNLPTIVQRMLSRGLLPQNYLYQSPCRHWFHRDCIVDYWNFQLENETVSCPNCRNQGMEEDVREYRIMQLEKRYRRTALIITFLFLTTFFSNEIIINKIFEFEAVNSLVRKDLAKVTFSYLQATVIFCWYLRCFKPHLYFEEENIFRSYS